MDRRGFLVGLTSVLAAPAIVKSENLMKLWIPNNDIIMPYKGVQGMDAGLYYAPNIPQFDIEKIVIIAKARALRARWIYEIT